MKVRKFWKILSVTLAGTWLLSACNICPPAGPWPQPPGCGASDTAGARDDNGCFPPSCDFIPDEAARIQCEEFKVGLDIWNWPQDCTLLPTNACTELCDNEKQRYIDTGHANWVAGIREDVEWWHEPYTKVYIFGTVSDRLEIFEPDARVMSAAPDEEDLLNMETAYSHYYNMPYGAATWFNYIEALDPQTNIHLVAFNEDQVPEALKPAMRRNLEGELVQNPHVEGVGLTGKEGIFFNSFHPEFMKYVLDEWKRLVDFEADGVGVDNLSGIVLVSDLPTHFDDYTVQEFGKYLAENLTPQEWEELGTSPQDFNYAEYLRSKGITSASFTVADDSWRQIPLVLEFRAFLTERNVETFCTWSEQIHAYAAEKGRYVTVSANMGGRSDTVLQEACVDFISSEYSYIGLDQPYTYHTAVPWAKIGNVKGKPMLNYVHLYDYIPLLDFTLNNPDLFVDFYRLASMESFAARSSMVHLRTDGGHNAVFYNDTLQAFKMAHDTSRLEQIKPAYDFMRRYKSYFADFNTSTARAAILYFNDLAYEFLLDDPGDQHYWLVRRLGEQLYRSGVDYEVIAPDMPFERYDLIVLPPSVMIPEAAGQPLLDFVSQGGRLVMFNQPGQGGALLQPGSHGDGEIILLTGQDPESQAADYILEQVGAVISDSSPALNVISYTDGKGDYVVHLFTSHTDLTQDFPVLENIHLTLPFSIEGMTVSYASLENPDLVSLAPVDIVIPALKTYGLLVIDKP